ncbi:MAG: ponA (ponA) [Acidobacteriaceae bacterium]|nr:ponA (ponA) [Acidobacteriaceae bacterium]
MALKLGTESKPKFFAAVGLGLAVLVLAVFQLRPYFGGASPAPAPAAHVTSAPRPAASASASSAPAGGSANEAAYPHQAVQVASSSALDPALHPEVMAQAERTTYSGNGRNIFSPDSAAPPSTIPKPVAAIRPSEPAAPIGPPPPPPVDLKFYGYSAPHDGQRQIFLLHGDDIFLAHEGDVVDRRYRVVSIKPLSVEIEDIPYHNTQSVPLSQN